MYSSVAKQSAAAVAVAASTQRRLRCSEGWMGRAVSGSPLHTSAGDRGLNTILAEQERDNYSSFSEGGREGDELFPWDLISFSPSCRKTGIVVPLLSYSSRPLSPVSSADRHPLCWVDPSLHALASSSTRLLPKFEPDSRTGGNWNNHTI